MTLFRKSVQLIFIFSFLLITSGYADTQLNDLLDIYQIAKQYSWDTLTPSQVSELQQQAIRFLPDSTNSFKFKQEGRWRFLPGIMARYISPDLPRMEVMIAVLYNPSGLENIASNESIKPGEWEEIPSFWTPNPRSFSKNPEDTRVVYSAFWQDDKWYCQTAVIGPPPDLPAILANQMAHDLFQATYAIMHPAIEKDKQPLVLGSNISIYDRWKLSTIDRKAREASKKAIDNVQAKVILDYLDAHNRNKRAYDRRLISFEQFDTEEKRLEQERVQKIQDSFNIGKQVYNDTYQRLLEQSGITAKP